MSNNALNEPKPVAYLDASRPLTPDERQRLKDEWRLKYGHRYTVILTEPTKAQYNAFLKEVVKRFEQGQSEGKSGEEWLKECFFTVPLQRTAKRLL